MGGIHGLRETWVVILLQGTGYGANKGEPTNASTLRSVEGLESLPATN